MRRKENNKRTAPRNTGAFQKTVPPNRAARNDVDNDNVHNNRTQETDRPTQRGRRDRSEQWDRSDLRGYSNEDPRKVQHERQTRPARRGTDIREKRSVGCNTEERDRLRHREDDDKRYRSGRPDRSQPRDQRNRNVRSEKTVTRAKISRCEKNAEKKFARSTESKGYIRPNLSDVTGQVNKSSCKDQTANSLRSGRSRKATVNAKASHRSVAPGKRDVRCYQSQEYYQLDCDDRGARPAVQACSSSRGRTEKKLVCPKTSQRSIRSATRSQCSWSGRYKQHSGCDVEVLQSCSSRSLVEARPRCKCEQNDKSGKLGKIVPKRSVKSVDMSEKSVELIPDESVKPNEILSNENVNSDEIISNGSVKSEEIISNGSVKSEEIISKGSVKSEEIVSNGSVKSDGPKISIETAKLLDDKPKRSAVRKSQIDCKRPGSCSTSGSCPCYKSCATVIRPSLCPTVNSQTSSCTCLRRPCTSYPASSHASRLREMQ